MTESQGGPLSELWQEIELGLAGVQEKISTAVLTGKDKDHRFAPNLLRLLHDEEGEVRYYALQALVLDLQQTDDLMRRRCWELLHEDPDEDVRRMAAACVGKILFGSQSLKAFRRLAAELKDAAQPRAVKGSIYAALFQVAGRPPLEWPGLRGPRKAFEESDIDWEKIAWLEDRMTSP